MSAASTFSCAPDFSGCARKNGWAPMMGGVAGRLCPRDQAVEAVRRGLHGRDLGGNAGHRPSSLRARERRDRGAGDDHGRHLRFHQPPLPGDRRGDRRRSATRSRRARRPRRKRSSWPRTAACANWPSRGDGSESLEVNAGSARLALDKRLPALKDKRYFFLSQGAEPCSRMTASGPRSTLWPNVIRCRPPGSPSVPGSNSTAFNKSKRLSSDGRPRWPSTESLAKIIEATGASLDEFLGAGRRQAVGAGAARCRARLRRCRCWASPRPAPAASSTMPAFRPGRAGTWSNCRRADDDGSYACRCRAIPCCRSTATATC